MVAAVVWTTLRPRGFDQSVCTLGKTARLGRAGLARRADRAGGGAGGLKAAERQTGAMPSAC